ncbi:hypothetical protein BGX24_001062 [Mortierella sp. AD032]|nr:hypothetical protein BGX24_001062 [Mortierella sp. AD032]
MSIAKFGIRSDGAWVFSDKQYAGSFVIKLYSISVPQQTHKDNETSRDIRSCFLQIDGTKLNKTLANFRRDFAASGTPSNLNDTLRIHFKPPDVKNGMSATHVRTNPETGVEDMMVYINVSKMDNFFFEKICLPGINMS